MSSSAPQRGDPTSDLLATAILVLAAGVMLIGWVMWLAGHLVLLSSGEGWVDASLTNAGRLIIELARHGDATAAWNAAFPASPSMVDRWLFWTITAILLAFAATVVGSGALLWREQVGSSRGGRGTPARWATRGHERRIGVPDDPDQRRWRLVAGRGRGTRRLLAGEDCVSAVVFGPNGSGKTTSLIVPNVLDWDGPVVLTTAKPQDLEPICTARAARGPVWVIAPGGARGREATGWSPVDAAVNAEAADRIAEWLVRVFRNDRRPQVSAVERAGEEVPQGAPAGRSPRSCGRWKPHELGTVG